MLYAVNIAAAGAFIIVMLMFSPWILVGSMRFTRSMTAYRNVRLGFTGTGTHLAWHILAPLILVGGILSGVLWVVATTAQSFNITSLTSIIVMLCFIGFGTYHYFKLAIKQFSFEHTQFGQMQMKSSLDWYVYLREYLGALFAGIALLLLYAFIAASMAIFSAKAIHSILDIDISALLLIVFLAPAYFLISASIDTRMRQYTLLNIAIKDTLRFNSTLHVAQLLKAYMLNAVSLLLTFGLAYPWCKVHIHRLLCQETTVFIDQEHLSIALDKAKRHSNAAGAETMEIMDISLDVGLSV